MNYSNIINGVKYLIDKKDTDYVAAKDYAELANEGHADEAELIQAFLAGCVSKMSNMTNKDETIEELICRIKHVKECLAEMESRLCLRLDKGESCIIN